MSEKIQINLTEAANQEVHVLHGQLPDPVNLKPIIIEGNISAPAEYFLKREKVLDMDHTMLSVNRRKGIMTLSIHPERPDFTRVTGTLESFADLDKLRINSGKPIEQRNFIQLLKFNKRLFATPAKIMDLVAKLTNFDVTAEHKVSGKDDKRGNKSAAIQQKINHELPNYLMVKCPLFEGDDPVEFKVDLIVDWQMDYESVGLVFMLESTDLAQMQLDAIDRSISTQAAKFEDKIPIIEE